MNFNYKRTWRAATCTSKVNLSGYFDTESIFSLQLSIGTEVAAKTITDLLTVFCDIVIAII